MKNRVSFVSSVCIMACVFRYICEKLTLEGVGNSQEVLENEGISIVLVMAFINAFALLFVIYLLLYNSIRITEHNINECRIDTSKKKITIKKVNRIVNIMSFCIFVTFVMVYMRCYSGFGNDILSIIALCLSIITDDVSKALGNAIYVQIKKKW